MRRRFWESIVPMLLLLAGVMLGWVIGSAVWGLVAGATVGILAAAFSARQTSRTASSIQHMLRNSAPAPLDQQTAPARGALGMLYREALRHVQTTEMRHRSASEQIQQQALLLDRMNEGLMRVSSEGIVTFANVAASSLFGGRNPVHRSFIGVTRDHELNAALWTCLRTGMQQRHTFELAGEGRIVDGVIVLLGDSPPEALVMLRDITEMNRLLNLRRDFIANVSHELRTPLSTIKVLTETLMDLRPDDEEAMKFLTQVDGEVDSMTALVRDLLDLTRLESGAGRIAVRHVDIATMVDEVCDRMRPLAHRHGVQLRACVDADVGTAAIDERRLQQALINLISNSVAHSSSGDEVVVCASGDRERIMFEVIDHGSGISKSDLPRVWERFFKSDRARTGPGTGLGLAIVKHIVQAHGGSVSATSELGVGSTFRITIPRGNESQVRQAVEAEGTGDIYVPG